MNLLIPVVEHNNKKKRIHFKVKKRTFIDSYIVICKSLTSASAGKKQSIRNTIIPV